MVSSLNIVGRQVPARLFAKWQAILDNTFLSIVDIYKKPI
jgi:hypothetical protein